MLRKWECMSKVIFNDKQIKLLSKNSNVLWVSHKAITYSQEFKNKFIIESLKSSLPRKIFENNDFDIEIIEFKKDDSCLIQKSSFSFIKFTLFFNFLFHKEFLKLLEQQLSLQHLLMQGLLKYKESFE